MEDVNEMWRNDRLRKEKMWRDTYGPRFRPIMDHRDDKHNEPADDCIMCIHYVLDNCQQEDCWCKEAV